MDIDCRSENSGQPFRKPRATLVSRLLCPFLLRKHFGEDYRGRHSFQKLENMGIRSEEEVAWRPFVCQCAPRATIHETCLQRAITNIVREGVGVRSGPGCAIQRDIKID